MKRGISALESLIALAIAGIALAPMLVLQADTTRAIAGAREDGETARATRNAIAVLDTINPMANSEGRMSLSGAQTLVWRAERITPITRALGYGGIETSFDIALYRIDAIIERANRGNITVSVERVGWRTATPLDETR
jgi:Tfp pilus assembly protein PilV